MNYVILFSGTEKRARAVLVSMLVATTFASVLFLVLKRLLSGISLSNGDVRNEKASFRKSSTPLKVQSSGQRLLHTHSLRRTDRLRPRLRAN